MPPTRPGRRSCLKCDREFNSRDVIGNRICPKCDKENSKEFTPRSASSRLYSGDGHHIGSIGHDADDR